MTDNPTRYKDIALEHARRAYKAQHGMYPSRSWRPLPAATVAPAATPVPYESPEAAAWRAAYAGAELGPQGARWEASGAQIRATWLLQPHTAGRPSPNARNF
jgi:hypothetical protein